MFDLFVCRVSDVGVQYTPRSRAQEKEVSSAEPKLQLTVTIGTLADVIGTVCAQGVWA